MTMPFFSLNQGRLTNYPTFTMSMNICCFCIVFVLTSSIDAQNANNRDIKSLESESDFNKINLHWQYEKLDEDLFDGFKITYCEDQAWGPHRCRNTMLKAKELSQTLLKSGKVQYGGQVSHLRMATNYTLEVTPIAVSLGAPGRSPEAKSRAIQDIGHSAQVFVQTKGFSAKAISCLTNSTLVEVETGPYFGGKISVEGSHDASCSTHGKTKDPTSKYRLDINHSLCGSKMINDSVRTYVLVQENLPILTHSTRRYMVVCHYIPEAFTVSAGVSLPGENDASLVPVDQSINEVDPSELFDSTNTIFNSRKFSRTGKALKFEQEKENIEESPQVWTQLVLMVVLVVGSVFGLSCAFWHFGRHAGVAAAIRGGLTAGERNAKDEVTSNNHHTTVIVADMLDAYPSLTESEHAEADNSEDLQTQTPNLQPNLPPNPPPIPERTDSSQESQIYPDNSSTTEDVPDSEIETLSNDILDPPSFTAVSNDSTDVVAIVSPSNWEKFEEYESDIIIV